MMGSGKGGRETPPIVLCTLTISHLLLSLLENPAGVSVEEREPNSLYMKGRVIK